MIDLAQLQTLDRTQALDVVNKLQINPIIKAVVLSQLRKMDDAGLKNILSKVQTMVEALQSKDAAQIDRLKKELEMFAAKSAIPKTYIDQLFASVMEGQAKNENA